MTDRSQYDEPTTGAPDDGEVAPAIDPEGIRHEGEPLPELDEDDPDAGDAG